MRCIRVGRHALAIGFLAVLLPQLAGAEASRDAAATLVKTESGSVQGVLDSGVSAFRGLPYARAPIGKLRWQPPQPVEPWTAIRAAAAFGPACPQPARGGRRQDGLGGAPELQSEDCLSLNVWTPAVQGKAAVMVWIHGGAHRYGASSLPFYDGKALAQQGVVLVSINYRLGLFGYFAHPALTAEAGAEQPLGNYGLLDQVAALQWVQRNIAQFGGDPSKVTVFGESAGGASILYLLGAPMAKSLFAQAIVESGGGWQRALSLAEKEEEGIKAVASTGLPTGGTTMEQLRSLSVDALNKAVSVAPILSFGPFIDGRTVKESPAASFRAGRAMDVPLIIGSNSYEASLLEATGASPAIVIERMPAEAVKAARAVYPDLAKDDEGLGRALFADGSFAAPARWIADRAHGGAPSWLYRFSYTLQARFNSPGAVHGGEIPFVFDTLSAVSALRLLSTSRDREMSRTISSCWVSFAKTGRPSCTGVPTWSAYSPDTDSLLDFGTPTALRSGFRKAALDFQQTRFEQSAGLIGGVR